MFTDWRSLAASSIFYESGWVDRLLWLHLCFAIPTPLVWMYTVVMALKRIPAEPGPCEYAARHRFWGWLSAVLMYLTTLTAGLFYLASFVL